MGPALARPPPISVKPSVSQAGTAVTIVKTANRPFRYFGSRVSQAWLCIGHRSNATTFLCYDASLGSPLLDSSWGPWGSWDSTLAR